MKVGHSLEVHLKPGHELALSLAETSLKFKANMRWGQHYWSTIGRHFLLWTIFLHEGDIGGYPIRQYHKKKWQIPKYCVENRPNTDTAYFNHIYNWFRILMVASI